MNADDAWCDWCGKANSNTAYRYDGRVFCTFRCIREYQAGQTTPQVTDLNEWVERSNRKDGPPAG